MKFALCILFLSAAASAAPASRLFAPADHDQIPVRLIARPTAAASLDRTPVQIAHTLDGAQALAAAPRPFVAQSREFWSEVGESELRAGMRITTTAPGALVRLSPQGGAGAALDPAGVLVRAQGRTQSAAEAASAIADARTLRSAGMAVPAGSLVFRLAPSAGSGEVEIAAPHAQGSYLVHVFEPDSAVVASLAADRDTVLVGDTLRLRVSLAGGAMMLASGLVTAPDGYSADLAFTRTADGAYEATFTPDATHRDGPQLWEAHAFTAARVGARSVLRDAKTAFAVSAPAARFDGTVTTRHDADLAIVLGIEAAGASRYQIAGVLYGTGADGALRPAALAQSAAWLEAGRGRIELRFDADTLAAAGVRAPFELRDLRLIDQADMGLLERRERALAIPQGRSD